jgi:hypothetical protein
MLKDCKGRNVIQQPSWETSGRGFSARQTPTPQIIQNNNNEPDKTG